MKKYNAALFDLDGVLVDTAKYHYLAWKELAQRLGALGLRGGDAAFAAEIPLVLPQRGSDAAVAVLHLQCPGLIGGRRCFAAAAGQNQQHEQQQGEKPILHTIAS